MCRITGSPSSMTYSSGSTVLGFVSRDELRTVRAHDASCKTRCSRSEFGRTDYEGSALRGRTKWQAVMVLTIFTLLGIAGAALTSSSSRTKDMRRMEHLAKKVVELKHEARRAQALESDELRLEVELNEQKKEIQRLRRLESTEKTKISSMQEEVEQIRREEKEKEEEVGGLLDMVFEQLKATRNEEAKKLREGAVPEKAVGVLEGHYKELSEKIQMRSRDSVIERYGAGPHRVMIQIEIPEDEINVASIDSQEANAHDLGTIVIEMASLDLMPHTVQVFLDQVHEGLWNECSFYRNAYHVLQATHKKGPANVTERFLDSGLANTKFQEYSPEFPHVKYSVGFGGMNAGSILMINKVDNSHVHGPGGQRDSFGVDDGEPCFGKVVAGFNTIEWLSQTPTSNEKGPDYMDNYVKILSASII